MSVSKGALELGAAAAAFCLAVTLLLSMVSSLKAMNDAAGKRTGDGAVAYESYAEAPEPAVTYADLVASLIGGPAGYDIVIDGETFTAGTYTAGTLKSRHIARHETYTRQVVYAPDGTVTAVIYTGN